MSKEFYAVMRDSDNVIVSPLFGTHGFAASYMANYFKGETVCVRTIASTEDTCHLSVGCGRLTIEGLTEFNADDDKGDDDGLCVHRDRCMHYEAEWRN